MIIMQIGESDFVQMFDDYKRSDNFTVAARRQLFDYYDGISDDCGEPFEIDVIAICCDWLEMTTGEINSEYGDSIHGCEDTLEWLSDNTTVIEVDHYEQESTYLVLSF